VPLFFNHGPTSSTERYHDHAAPQFSDAFLRSRLSYQRVAGLILTHQAFGVFLDTLFRKNEAMVGGLLGNPFVLVQFEKVGGIAKVAAFLVTAFGLEVAELAEVFWNWRKTVALGLMLVAFWFEVPWRMNSTAFCGMTARV